MKNNTYRGKKTPDSNYAGKWVYGSLVTCENGTMMIVQAKRYNLTLSFRVRPETVSKSLGIFDTSEPKKEIFEGDIISDADSKHLIKYDDDNCRFAALPIPERSWQPKYLRKMGVGAIDQDWINHFNKKVIGNEIDNPELLISE